MRVAQIHHLLSSINNYNTMRSLHYYKAIIEEYTDELLFCPTTEQGWRNLADKWYQRWNFPHTVGGIDGKHVACKAPLQRLLQRDLVCNGGC